MSSFTEYMIEQIEDKTKKRAKVLPMWRGHDADIVLCDLMKQTDFERNGIAQDIFIAWKYSDEILQMPHVRSVRSIPALTARSVTSPFLIIVIGASIFSKSCAN